MKYPTVDDIKSVNCAGSWAAKSGGQLEVLFKFPYQILQAFTAYDEGELRRINQDIRGLRSYRVSGISRGAIGANEWHKVRNEIVYALKGSFKWTCIDAYSNTKEFILDKDTAVFTPSYILHTYEALEDDSTIAVVANTLFDPDDSSTHDTYTADTFPG